MTRVSHFEYPDAVRGIYVTGHSAGGADFQDLVELLDSTDLNAMVIDIKDDFGNVTYIPADDSPLVNWILVNLILKIHVPCWKYLRKSKFIQSDELSSLKIVFLRKNVQIYLL